MRKRPLIKFQLLLLVVVVGLLIWRMNSTTQKVEGFVAFSDLSVSRLYLSDFQVSDPTTIRIEAMAAYESEDASSPLAVYPWIIDSESLELIWKPEPASIQRSGVEASISDSILVPPGHYTAYYSTFGPSVNSDEGGSFLGLKPYWTNDPSFWKLSLTESGDEGNVRKVGSLSGGRGDDTQALWSFLPIGRDMTESQMFKVESTSNVRLDVTAALCSSRCDQIELFRVPDSTPFWTLEEGMTQPAGGAPLNRSFSGLIELEPGLYRIEYTVGRYHYYGHWQANPPWAPEKWGLRLYSEGGDQVQLFDPWNNQEPLAALLQVGNSEDLEVVLEIDKPLSVVVYAMGELRRGDDRYDFAWIEREGRAAPIWSMSYEGSIPAGGDVMNRKEMVVLSLEPGKYHIRYRTDDSHSYPDWNKRKPQDPERWGVAVFAMNPREAEDAAVRVSVPSGDWAPQVDVVEVTDSQVGEVLVQRIGLEDDTIVNEPLMLEEETQLRIVALGEITRGSRNDYGWIERVPSGEHVWEMTYQNTVAAGGADLNRRFSGMITLEAGEYIVHFETDLSHSYGSFDGAEPRNAQDWGIQVFRVDE